MKRTPAHACSELSVRQDPDRGAKRCFSWFFPSAETLKMYLRHYERNYTRFTVVFFFVLFCFVLFFFCFSVFFFRLADDASNAEPDGTRIEEQGMIMNSIRRNSSQVDQLYSNNYDS